MYALDIVIKDATIVDGSGGAAFSADIGIKDSIITCVGKTTASAKETIKSEGLIVCPGFIDSHTHIDLSFVNYLGAANYLMQGVTSTVGGHCGISMAPVLNEEFYDLYAKSMMNIGFNRSWGTFAEWLTSVESWGIGINYVPLVGLNMLRAGIMGKDCYRFSNHEERALIAEELGKALDAGAFGLSASFDAATPGYYADEREVLTLLKVLQEKNRIFAPHTRHHQNQTASEDQAYGLFIGKKAEVITGRYHGFIEVLEYAEQVQGLNMMISHLTPSCLVPQPHPSYLDVALARATLDEIIDQPRNRGLNVSFNMLPADYSIGSEQLIASSFGNKALGIPEVIKSLSRAELSHRCREDDFRKVIIELVNNGRLKFGMLSAATDPYWSQCFRFTSNVSDRFLDKTAFEIARAKYPRNIAKVLYEEAINVVCEVLIECPEAKWSMIWDKREAGTYQEILRHPFGMPCGDSASYEASPNKSISYLGYGISPLAFNLMPSFLIEMVKNRKYLKLEEAIRKMTSLPATILGVEKRGLVKEGYYADLVVMDWDGLGVHHDFRAPEIAPEGIEYTIVNGKIAYQQKSIVGGRSGKVLRRG